MKKLFAAVATLFLLGTPIFADDQNAAPATDTAATAPATDTTAPADTTAAAPAPKAKKSKGNKMESEEAAIKKSFSGVSEAWAAGDVDGVASHFTGDGSLINPMGMEGRGMAEIKKVIEGEFSGPMKGTQQTFDDFSFTWVMPNLAMVDCTGTVTGMKKADGTDADPMKVHVYGMIVNRGKGWKARSIRAYAFLQPPSADTSAAPAAASTSQTAPAAGNSK